MNIIRYYTKRAWDGLYDLHKETVQSIPGHQEYLQRVFHYKVAAIIQAVSWAVLYREAFIETTATKWVVIRSIT